MYVCMYVCSMYMCRLYTYVCMLYMLMRICIRLCLCSSSATFPVFTPVSSYQEVTTDVFKI
jgi:hypothetical protein